MNRSRHRWSWSVGRLAGIDVRVHGTFVILLAWVLLSHLLAGHGWTMALTGLLVVSVVFGVVVLHELGHALVARRFGIRTRDITLLPIGGVATLERMPEDPRQELLVAIAGPLVNVALAAIAGALVVAMGAPWSPRAITTVGAPLLTQFLWLNVGLAVFNMLPAFPTDGGRVLRALLAMRFDRVRATDVAARVGQWMALALGVLGLFGMPMLVFIALFVWMGAAQEASMVHTNAALAHVTVGDAMVTTFDTVSPEATAGEVLDRALHSMQSDFPVVDHERLLGVVHSRDLALAVSRGATRAAVATLATPIGPTATPEELALGALGDQDVLPVLRDGALVGLLLPEAVAQVAALHDARLHMKG